MTNMPGQIFDITSVNLQGIYSKDNVYEYKKHSILLCVWCVFGVFSVVCCVEK